MNIAETIAEARAKADKIAKLEDQIAALKADLDTLKAAIITEAEKTAEEDEKGTKRAEIATDAGTAKVTWPVATLKLTEDNYADAKKLAGEAFARIAEKVPVAHKLLKAARDLIPALLPKPKADKLLALLASEASSPRVTFA